MGARCCCCSSRREAPVHSARAPRAANRQVLPRRPRAGRAGGGSGSAGARRCRGPGRDAEARRPLPSPQPRTHRLLRPRARARMDRLPPPLLRSMWRARSDRSASSSFSDAATADGMSISVSAISRLRLEARSRGERSRQLLQIERVATALLEENVDLLSPTSSRASAGVKAPSSTRVECGGALRSFERRCESLGHLAWANRQGDEHGCGGRPAQQRAEQLD